MSLAARAQVALVSLAALGLVLAPAAPAAAQTSGPPAPVDLFNGLEQCSTDATAPAYLNSFDGIQIEGLSQDTNQSDGPLYTQQFQVWPVSDPAQITTLTNSFVLLGHEGVVTVPAADLTNGQTYAWQTDVTAASGTSGWSATCYFEVEDTPPANAPTVTSSNYPLGQQDQGGAPMQITFGADGDSDVAGYVYSWVETLPAPILATTGPDGILQPVNPYTAVPPVNFGPAGFVQAPELGGSATFSVIPEYPAGLLILTVASLDQAFNESPPATYEFDVASTAPTISQQGPQPQFGGRTNFHITASTGLQSVSKVVSYTLTLTGFAQDDGQVTETSQKQTVSASGGGVAEVKFDLDGIDGDTLSVTSTSADGWVSNPAVWVVQFDTEPVVSSQAYPEGGTSGGVGVPGTFTFSPSVNNVASYTYSVNDGPAATVSANGQGVAQVTYTPTASGFYDLNVYSTTSAGLETDSYDYIFFVN